MDLAELLFSCLAPLPRLSAPKLRSEPVSCRYSSLDSTDLRTHIVNYWSHISQGPRFAVDESPRVSRTGSGFITTGIAGAETASRSCRSGRCIPSRRRDGPGSCPCPQGCDLLGASGGKRHGLRQGVEERLGRELL